MKDFEKRVNEIDLEFKVFLDENKNQIAFVDGIIDFESYLNSKIKIMWILKEPNSTEEGLDWREEIRELKTETGIKFGWEKTFLPIIYSTYGILNNKNWNEIPDVSRDPEIVDVLKSIAFVNVKKIAGESVAHYKELVDFHNKHGKILLKQIEVYNPDVIICGSTFDIIGTDIIDDNFELIQEFKLDVHRSKKRIILDAYHPNNRVRGLTKEKYCDTIINSVLKYKNP